MSTHLYQPTSEEIERVRRHVAMNSAYYEGGQPMPGRHGRDALYPRGFTSFAQQVGVNMRQLSRIMNGSGTKRSTWARIEAYAAVDLRFAPAVSKALVRHFRPIMNRNKLKPTLTDRKILRGLGLA